MRGQRHNRCDAVAFAFEVWVLGSGLGFWVLGSGESSGQRFGFGKILRDPDQNGAFAKHGATA